MTNPFSLTSLDMLSNRALVKSIKEYRKFLQHLGQFSNSLQIQRIRTQVRDALAEMVEEAEKRTCFIPGALV